MKIDLTPLSWLKKDEKPKKEYCCKREIIGMVLAYIGVAVTIHNFILGLVILAVASYIVWTN